MHSDVTTGNYGLLEQQEPFLTQLIQGTAGKEIYLMSPKSMPSHHFKKSLCNYLLNHTIQKHKTECFKHKISPPYFSEKKNPTPLNANNRISFNREVKKKSSSRL